MQENLRFRFWHEMNEISLNLLKLTFFEVRKV